MSFSNQVVVVTGASSGIGASAAVMFAKEGANVVIIGRNETKLKKTAKDCSDHGKYPLIITADVTKDDDAERIIQETIATYGALNVLVNSAGIIYFGTMIDGKVVEAFDKVIGINLRAVIKLSTLATPHLIKTRGNIVNVSSITGKKIIKRPDYLAYNVSKAALDHFTRGAAFELSSSGVRVNAVSPGPVRTDFLENAGSSTTWDEISTHQPLQRVSEPQEIANIILFLASDKAKGVTGSNYVCDNGAFFQ